MEGKIKNLFVGAALFLVLAVGGIVAGCIDSDEKPTLIQTGSSTVLPLGAAWAEEFDGANIQVSGGGSSHGLNSLLKGEADLGDASRLMKGSDYEAVGGDKTLVKSDGTATGAAPGGVWPYKWVVAYDVLATVVNNQNTWAANLNYSQLYKIFTDDDPAVYWDEVPGLSGAPHEKIEIYAPDEASGTYDYFFESIIKDWGKATQVAKTRLESSDGVYHPSADDNVILNAIKANKYAIGYFGFAYLIENPGQVKAVNIAKSGTSYVEPSLATVATYPMARPLHIYTNGLPKKDTAKGKAIYEYIEYILGDEGQAIVPEVGYVKLALVNPSMASDQLSKLHSG